jgi:hypothetical protein
MQQRHLLIVGLLLIAGVVAYVTWPTRVPSTAPSAGASGGGRGRAGGADSAVDDVRLESLQREQGPLKGPERNPFRFERRGGDAPARGPVRRTQVELPPPGPVLPPPPPPIPLRFIGYLQPTGAAGRVAVLSDGRGNVFDGREGDIIEGRYRLLRVGNDSADLIYLDGRGRQTIRLSGQ